MYQKTMVTEGWRDYLLMDMDTGKPINQVHEADDETGFYRKYREDENGRMLFVIGPDGKKQPVSELFHGNVKFIDAHKPPEK